MNLFSHELPIRVERLPNAEETHTAWWNAPKDGDFRSSIIEIIFSPNGQLLVTRSSDGIISLWDPLVRALLRTLENHVAVVNAIVFSPDGQLLASAAWKAIQLWDPLAGTLLRTLEGHSQIVSSVLFSPDGQLLASAYSDCSVILWETSTGQEIWRMENVYRRKICFSADGSRLELDERLIDVPSVYSSIYGHKQEFTESLYSLDVDKNFVLYKGSKVLHYLLKGQVALQGHMLVVTDGRNLYFFRFSETSTTA